MPDPKQDPDPKKGYFGFIKLLHPRAANKGRMTTSVALFFLTTREKDN